MVELLIYKYVNMFTLTHTTRGMLSITGKVSTHWQNNQHKTYMYVTYTCTHKHTCTHTHTCRQIQTHTHTHTHTTIFPLQLTSHSGVGLKAVQFPQGGEGIQGNQSVVVKHNQHVEERPQIRREALHAQINGCLQSRVLVVPLRLCQPYVQGAMALLQLLRHLLPPDVPRPLPQVGPYQRQRHGGPPAVAHDEVSPRGQALGGPPPRPHGEQLSGLPVAEPLGDGHLFDQRGLDPVRDGSVTCGHHGTAAHAKVLGHVRSPHVVEDEQGTGVLF